MDPSPKEKFERWVLRPIEALRKLPNGDGAFAALSICCGLYERFIDSQLKTKGQVANGSAFHELAASDLGCEKKAMERFWNGFRLGLQHAFQPKAYAEKKGAGDKWGWDIAEAEGYHKHPQIIQQAPGVFIVRIDPWKFVEHVLKRWEEHPELINVLSEFALGRIGRLQNPVAGPGSEVTVQLAGHRTLSHFDFLQSFESND